MFAPLKRTLLVLCTLVGVQAAFGFSMLGPFTGWQVSQIGYQIGADIGGPMNLGEEYRWNVKTIYYGYDESFLNYFGAQGTNAIEDAFAIMNALPAFSAMSSNLTEFSQDTKRINYTASALNVMDLKSYCLAELTEEMGLASPERYVWTLRDRVAFPAVTNYTVIKRNFDPVTLAPSSFVNGVLYTYVVIDPLFPNVADAIEIQIDPLQHGFSSVATGVDDQVGLAGHLVPGDYFTGLTRDDIGGLRYLYRTNNFQFENLLDTTIAGGSAGQPWQPIGGTNATGTNGFVGLAVRPGVNKITFKHAAYDSLVGSFITFTNIYTDIYVTNSTLKQQTVGRVINAPDILIAAEDLYPARFSSRTDTAGWANNDALNGTSALDGPGVIQPPIVVTFSKLGPFLINQNPGFLDEVRFIDGGAVWGRYDGSTNAPYIFPQGTSIYDLEYQILNGTAGNIGDAWTIPNSFSTNTVTTASP